MKDTEVRETLHTSSNQDTILLRQYLHVLRGSARTHGPHVASLQAAYIAAPGSRPAGHSPDSSAD
jgi:hypothetical protein